MITASLLIFSLIIEYMYDPIIEKPSDRIIKKTFALFRDSLNSTLDKFYIYLLFPISVYIVLTIIVSILGNSLHPFFSFLINLFILFYCLKPNEFILNMEKIKNEKFLDNCKDDKIFIRMMSTKKYDINSIKNNLFYNSLRNIFSKSDSIALLSGASLIVILSFSFFKFSNLNEQNNLVNTNNFDDSIAINDSDSLNVDNPVLLLGNDK